MPKTKVRRTVGRSLEKSFGFPFKIPISYKGHNLGTATIDYIMDQDYVARSPKEDRGLFNMIVFAELAYLSLGLKDIIDLAIRIDNEFRAKQIETTLLLKLFHFPYSLNLNPYTNYLIKSDMVFKVIEKEGLAAFRNSLIFDLVQYWLANEKKSRQQLNRLITSLEVYGKVGHSMPGRHKLEIFEILGTEWLGDMAYDITSILKLAKKNRGDLKLHKINDLINKASKEYLTSLKIKHEQNQESLELGIRYYRLEMGLKDFWNRNLSNPIAKCIEGDELFIAEFSSYRYEPNKLAKEIISRLLDISISKVESLLYRKHKNIEVS